MYKNKKRSKKIGAMLAVALMGTTFGNFMNQAEALSAADQKKLERPVSSSTVKNLKEFFSQKSLDANSKVAASNKQASPKNQNWDTFKPKNEKAPVSTYDPSAEIDSTPTISLPAFPEEPDFNNRSFLDGPAISFTPKDGDRSYPTSNGYDDLNAQYNGGTVSFDSNGMNGSKSDGNDLYNQFIEPSFGNGTNGSHDQNGDKMNPSENYYDKLYNQFKEPNFGNGTNSSEYYDKLSAPNFRDMAGSEAYGNGYKDKYGDYSEPSFSNGTNGYYDQQGQYGENPDFEYVKNMKAPETTTLNDNGTPASEIYPGDMEGAEPPTFSDDGGEKLREFEQNLKNVTSISISSQNRAYLNSRFPIQRPNTHLKFANKTSKGIIVYNPEEVILTEIVDRKSPKSNYIKKLPCGLTLNDITYGKKVSKKNKYGMSASTAPMNSQYARVILRIPNENVKNLVKGN